MSKSTTTTTISPIIKGAIRDAVIKALKAAPVVLNISANSKNQVYAMDGQTWVEDSAVDHILNEYSWWNK